MLASQERITELLEKCIDSQERATVAMEHVASPERVAPMVDKQEALLQAMGVLNTQMSGAVRNWKLPSPSLAVPSGGS